MIFAGWSLAARIGAPLIVLGVLAAGVWAYGHRQHRAGKAEVRAEWDAARERQRIVDTAERARRDAEQLEVARAALDQAARDRADAAAAGAAADRLRHAYTAAVQRCGGAPAAPGGSAAADARDVLADVQRRLDAAAGELAALADARGTAGAACERAYDALRP